MRTLELALSPPPASLIPSFKHSTTQSVGIDVKTTFDAQLLLRRPKHQSPEPVVVLQPHIAIDRSQIPIPRYSTSDILRIMDSLSLPGNEDLYSCLAKESTSECDQRGAYELTVHIMKSSVRPRTTFLNRLLLMHVSCGRLDTARQVFDRMPHRDFHSWAILILGYIEMGDFEEAALLFVSMLKHQNGASKITPWIMGCVLKASAMIRDLGLGQQVHGLCQKLGFIEEQDSSCLSGSLIRFYGEFGCLEDANLVLHQLSNADTLVWAAKVSNDYREGEFQQVISDFIEMGKHGVQKNALVFSSVLKASTWVSDGGRSGGGVHADAIKLGFDSDCLIRCRLIEMYGKYGKVKDAEKAFMSREDETNVSCWNAMVAGYMQNGCYIEAIKLLYQMKATGITVQDRLLNEVKLKPTFR
ncbi:pentatricopeptide repeat-containing protein At1g31790-like [Brassica napus]|uniref:pentatricopeptide repeat-containing protein At1g31790-like n=1 Tax=Brassica napus TaxID=3708 RepID=UPI0020788FF1|nr:pentatricopeptide repeat-containing protein At1g31790-like [Brassica napus]